MEGALEEDREGVSERNLRLVLEICRVVKKKKKEEKNDRNLNK